MTQDTQFGAITTTTTTADQVILTYTVPGARKLLAILIVCYYTTWSATEAALGVVKYRIGAVDKGEFRMQNTDLDSLCSIVVIPLGSGQTFSTETIAIVCTPASTTSMRWAATLFFEV